MRSLPIIAAFCAAFAASPAVAYLTSNSLVVEPRGEDFHIPYRGESGARAFWCAAGEYAEKRLNLPGDTRIYRTTETPRRSGQGIGFSLNPSKSVGDTGLATFGAPGGGITVAHARGLCDTDLLLFR